MSNTDDYTKICFMGRSLTGMESLNINLFNLDAIGLKQDFYGSSSDGIEN